MAVSTSFLGDVIGRVRRAAVNAIPTRELVTQEDSTCLPALSLAVDQTSGEASHARMQADFPRKTRAQGGNQKGWAFQPGVFDRLSFGVTGSVRPRLRGARLGMIRTNLMIATAAATHDKEVTCHDA